MGLDITACGKLTAVARHPEGEDEESLRIDQTSLDYTEKYFPGRTAGLAPGIYSPAETFPFRAGSYSGYGEWRNQLAIFAGWPSAKHVWENVDTGPFVELINFSDCEGYIGPQVAAKLAKDFADHAARAAKAEPWFAALYRSWRTAFEIASDGGCVVFH